MHKDKDRSFETQLPIYNIAMSLRQKQETVDVRTLGSLAVGLAAGMVLADRISRPTREVAALTLLSAGLVATVPFLTKYVTRQINAPSHRFGSRKTLQGIRRSEVSEFSMETDGGEDARELVPA